MESSNAGKEKKSGIWYLVLIALLALLTARAVFPDFFRGLGDGLTDSAHPQASSAP